ncbi:MAG: hypothetical protein GKR88_19740 [Flavobacteriaceae bacterium]|nr:MAG: hypothetical protein GKR88_19740 [Flavobacteriaceae bacterium]
MKTNLLKNYSFLLFLGFVFNSCVNNLDFNQVDYSATPVYNSPIIFFDLNQNHFIDTATNTDILTLTEITNITVFENSFIRDNTERVAITIEVNNQFNRNFTFAMDFLDGNNNVLYSAINFTAPSNQLTVPVIAPIVIANNQNFLSTRKIRVTIQMSAGTTMLDPDIIQNVSFKSTGIYYIRT